MKILNQFYITKEYSYDVLYTLTKVKDNQGQKFGIIRVLKRDPDEPLTEINVISLKELFETVLTIPSRYLSIHVGDNAQINDLMSDDDTSVNIVRWEDTLISGDDVFEARLTTDDVNY